MTKASDAFRTIGEMAEELGVKPHILRYWEEQFPMLNPLKRRGGRRHYRAEDAVMLRTIDRLLNSDGYTIKGARKFLTENPPGVRPETEARLEEAEREGAPRFDLDAEIGAFDPARKAGLSTTGVKRLQDVRDRLVQARAAVERIGASVR